jgi:hypothetical protein
VAVPKQDPVSADGDYLRLRIQADGFLRIVVSMDRRDRRPPARFVEHGRGAGMQDQISFSRSGNANRRS